MVSSIQETRLDGPVGQDAGLRCDVQYSFLFLCPFGTLIEFSTILADNASGRDVAVTPLLVDAGWVG